MAFVFVVISLVINSNVNRYLKSADSDAKTLFERTEIVSSLKRSVFKLW